MYIEYTFPFSTCLSQKITRIYVFGAGQIGNKFQQQIEEQSDIVNLGFIDNFITVANTQNDPVKKIGVSKPDALNDVKFDAIVLACSYYLIPEICDCLFRLGIDSNKIITPEIRFSSNTPALGDGWDNFYNASEERADDKVKGIIVPIIEKHPISFERILDFPSGRGRIAEHLFKIYGDKIHTFTLCDANKEAIEYCKERFSHSDCFNYFTNVVDEWQCVKLDFDDNSFSFIYSFDSMVHFSYKWLDFYIGEFKRTLQSGGYAFVHHSNLASPNVDIRRHKSEYWQNNPSWRSLVSAEDVHMIAERHGFSVVEQTLINWVIPNLDCITILRRQ
ncbi:MAG: class I SAM-dependent methyltransferase [Defluviitaleaceae bacterium]|nr:class I SAM-dependent methyltransferase [Defluviitaleaceae bacterium]